MLQVEDFFSISTWQSWLVRIDPHRLPRLGGWILIGWVIRLLSSVGGDGCMLKRGVIPKVWVPRPVSR